MRKYSVLLSLTVAFVFFSASARASTLDVDPELLRFTALGQTFPSGTIDPVPIGSNGFRLNYVSEGQGNTDLIDPVLLILAIPTGSTAPALSFSSASGVTSVAIDLGGTTTIYGGSWNTATGQATNNLSASGQNAYDRIGLNPGGSPSANYTNFTGATTGVTTWNLFVYTLNFTPASSFSPGDWVEITGTLAANTFVLAYGCDGTTGSGSSTVCDAVGNTFSTPFTYAGLVTGGSGQGGSGQGGSGQAVVPEPASLLLLGSGIGLVASKVRNRAKRQAAKS